MKLKTKIWLLMGILTSGVLATDLKLSYDKLKAEQYKEMANDVRVIYGYVMATRRIYQEQFVSSGIPLNDKTVGFLPAHSLSLISKDFANWNESGVTFNNVSDRPRNPDNLADRFELEEMQRFRDNPESKPRIRNITVDDGTRYALYAEPIWVEKFCLKCHDTPETSPAGISKLYPDTAYEYKVGDLRGLVSIRLPSARLENQLLDIWFGRLTSSLVGYLILFLSLGFLINRIILRRLCLLKFGAEKFSGGDYESHVATTGSDEISDLAKTFNSMMHKIQARNQDLVKLSSAVEQSPISIFITDLDARIEYANQYFLGNSGYLLGEVIGHTPAFLKSGTTTDETYRTLWSTLAKGEIWQGELVNRKKDGSLYTDLTQISPIRDTSGDVTHYLSIQQDITDKKQTEERIYQLANFDKLTGLPNRTLLLDRLQQLLTAERESEFHGVLMLLNVDRFKNINNAKGQAFGDNLLSSLSELLSSLLREGETLARLAADEFAVLIPDVGQQPAQATRKVLILAERLHKATAKPFEIEAESVSISISIGATIFKKSTQIFPVEILKQAETSLHRVKANGGNQTGFFKQHMTKNAEKRYQIERALHDAIANNELCLFLQPQVDAAGKVISAEVLLRWEHPEKGLIPPGVFIPIAEESDLIIDIGNWVLLKSMKLMARESLAGNSLYLSVNISPRHFKQEDFVANFYDMLAVTGADPSQLTLEVTENLMIENINDLIAKMSELTDLGVHFSMDDFGTGYSALSYLKRLPIHELKIDKTFVQDAPTDPDDAALVEIILIVAEQMHLKVVAEGVETQQQADFLNERSIVLHQGYLFGKPELAEHWITKWKAQALESAEGKSD